MVGDIGLAFSEPRFGELRTEECLLVCAERFEVVVLRDTLLLLCEGYRVGPDVLPANMEVGVAGG